MKTRVDAFLIAPSIFFFLLAGFIWYSLRPRPDEIETYALIGLFVLMGLALPAIILLREKIRYQAEEPVHEVDATDDQTSSFFHQAANASWLAPFILLGVGLLVRQRASFVDDTSVLIFEIVTLAACGLGLLFGIIALFGLAKHGRKGILLPAAIGIILNTVGVLAGIFLKEDLTRMFLGEGE